MAREISDDAFDRDKLRWSDVKAVLVEYIDDNRNSMDDVAAQMGLDPLDERDEIAKRAFRIFNENAGDVRQLVAKAASSDLADPNDVGDLMSSFTESVMNSIDEAATEARKAALPKMSPRAWERAGRPYDGTEPK